MCGFAFMQELMKLYNSGMVPQKYAQLYVSPVVVLKMKQKDCTFDIFQKVVFCLALYTEDVNKQFLS